jgi:fatty-acyl-CoA synthase
MARALKLRKGTEPIYVIQVEDSVYGEAAEQIGAIDYESFVAQGDAGFDWQARRRMGCDCAELHQRHHRQPQGRGLPPSRRAQQRHQQCAGVGHAQARRLSVDAAHVPLQRLVLPWTVAARAAVNVCLRRVDAQAVFDAIRNHGVTHYCGAPIVHSLLVNAPAAMKQGVPAGVKAMVAGAAPPASMIEGMEAMGFDITHVYGLTETYGPATVCAKHEAGMRSISASAPA